MTDTTQTLPPGQAAGPAIGIDPASVPAEQRPALIDALVKNGFNREVAEKHFQAVQPTPSGNAALDAARKAFVGTDEQFQERLQQVGITKADATNVVTDPVFDPRLNAPASDRDYPMDYAGRQRNYEPKAFARFDSEARAAFKSMEVPASMASGLLQNMLESAEKSKTFTSDLQANLWKQEQSIYLDRAWPGGAAKARELAEVTMAKMPADVRKQWETAGLFLNAKVLVTLGNIGSLIKTREVKKPKGE